MFMPQWQMRSYVENWNIFHIFCVTMSYDGFINLLPRRACLQVIIRTSADFQDPPQWMSLTIASATADKHSSPTLF